MRTPLPHFVERWIDQYTYCPLLGGCNLDTLSIRESTHHTQVVQKVFTLELKNITRRLLKNMRTPLSHICCSAVAISTRYQTEKGCIIRRGEVRNKPYAFGYDGARRRLLSFRRWEYDVDSKAFDIRHSHSKDMLVVWRLHSRQQTSDQESTYHYGDVKWVTNHMHSVCSRFEGEPRLFETLKVWKCLLFGGCILDNEHQTKKASMT